MRLNTTYVERPVAFFPQKCTFKRISLYIYKHLEHLILHRSLWSYLNGSLSVVGSACPSMFSYMIVWCANINHDAHVYLLPFCTARVL